MLGPFQFNRAHEGDCLEQIPQLPDASIDVVVTSPPYWGQRHSKGIGVEADPRDYVKFLTDVFMGLLPKLKPGGVLWINIGDAYNTPVNWREDDRQFSTLGADRTGLPAHNSAGIMVDILRMVPVKSRVSTGIAVDRARFSLPAGGSTHEHEGTKHEAAR
jgi:hypothetical protein